MIIEDYVSFETAKLLKEKGFNAELKMYWNKDFKNEPVLNCCPCPFDDYEPDGIKPIEIDNSGRSCDSNHWWHPEDFDCVAPTLQMAMTWLREVHNKHCDTGYDIDLGWFFQIIDLKETVEYDYPETKYYHTENETGFNTYEEACEAAIKYCLENLI